MSLVRFVQLVTSLGGLKVGEARRGTEYTSRFVLVPGTFTTTPAKPEPTITPVQGLQIHIRPPPLITLVALERPSRPPIPFYQLLLLPLSP